MIVHPGAEDVLLDAGAGDQRRDADDEGRARDRSEVDIEIFGLGGPVRPEQAEQGERRLDAGAGRPAAPGVGDFTRWWCRRWSELMWVLMLP